MQCVAVWCSVLQCDAVRCSVLYCVAVCCSVLQCVILCCSVLQCAAVIVCLCVCMCVYMCFDTVVWMKIESKSLHILQISHMFLWKRPPCSIALVRYLHFWDRALSFRERALYIPYFYLVLLAMKWPYMFNSSCRECTFLGQNLIFLWKSPVYSIFVPSPALYGRHSLETHLYIYT